MQRHSKALGLFWVDVVGPACGHSRACIPRVLGVRRMDLNNRHQLSFGGQSARKVCSPLTVCLLRCFLAARSCFEFQCCAQAHTGHRSMLAVLFVRVDAGTQRMSAPRMQECRVHGAECRVGAHRSARELSTGVPSGASRTSRSRQPDEHGAVRQPRPRA